MEEAFLCQSSGTNVACAPLLVLRESSPPPCPATEVAWASSSCSASPRRTTLRQSGSPSLLSEVQAAGFPRPGGLLADRDGAAVSLRPFGLSTFHFRGSSVEPWSSFFLASELISWLSQQAAACWRQGKYQRNTLRSRRTVVRGVNQPCLANQIGWQPVSFISPPKRTSERTVGVAV